MAKPKLYERQRRITSLYIRHRSVAACAGRLQTVPEQAPKMMTVVAIMAGLLTMRGLSRVDVFRMIRLNGGRSEMFPHDRHHDIHGEWRRARECAAYGVAEISTTGDAVAIEEVEKIVI